MENVIFEPYSGILLTNVSNGVIRDNSIVNINHGVQISYSSYIQILENNASNTDYGTTVFRDSHHNLVENNILSDIRFYGIFVSGNDPILIPHSNTFKNNDINIRVWADSRRVGINHVYGYSDNILDNVITGATKGISLGPLTSASLISGNNIYNNENGIKIEF